MQYSYDAHRVKLIMNSSSITNLEKYQVEYAAYILFRREKPMTILEIIRDIKDEFQIDFTEQELLNSIKKYDREKDFTRDNGFWTISPERIKRIQNKLAEPVILRHFVEEYKDKVGDTLTIDEIELIVKRFMYHCFDKNKQNIIELLKGNNEGSVEYKMGDFNATVDEKLTINKFLNWENKEKNQFLYRSVNAGYTYGMITLKQDINPSVFIGKVLYLDTNVVIALSNIGNLSRSFALRQFHDKCIKNNIKLCVTSLTIIEINDLIKGKTLEIRSFIKESGGVVDPDRLLPLNSGGMEDFYNEYYEWHKNNDWRNFTAFENYLNSKVNDILQLLSIENIDLIEIKKHAKYEVYKEQLRSLKKERKGYYKNEAIDNDIQNFINVESKTINSSTLWDQSYYIVSLDNTYKCWSDSLLKLVPIVIHPSMWLSLLMRLNTRTDNDFEAYCKFLTLPVNDYQISDVTNIMREAKTITSDRDIQVFITSEIMRRHNSVSELSSIELKQASLTYHDKFMKEIHEKIERYHEEQRIKEKEVHETEKSKAIEDERLRAKQAKMDILRSDVSVKTEKKMKKYKFYETYKKYIYSTLILIISLLILTLMVAMNFTEHFANTFEGIGQLGSSILSYVMITSISGLVSPIIVLINHLLFKWYYKNYDYMYKRVYDRIYTKEFKKIEKYL